MNNKKDDLNEFNFLLVIIISLIISSIIYNKFDLESLDVSSRGFDYLIFGIVFTIWYLIIKIRKIVKKMIEKIKNERE